MTQRPEASAEMTEILSTYSRLRHRSRDLELPGMYVVQRRRREELTPQAHDTVIRLRRAGIRVYRAGRSHSRIDGKRVANQDLVVVAARFVANDNLK